MSVRYWANQHGAGVTLDGEHLAFVSKRAAEWGCTLEEAVDRVISDGLDPPEKKKPPLAER